MVIFMVAMQTAKVPKESLISGCLPWAWRARGKKRKRRKLGEGGDCYLHSCNKPTSRAREAENTHKNEMVSAPRIQSCVFVPRPMTEYEIRARKDYSPADWL